MLVKLRGGIFLTHNVDINQRLPEHARVT